MTSMKVPTKEEQSAEIKSILRKETLQAADTWYVCSQDWWKKWADCVGFSEFGSPVEIPESMESDVDAIIPEITNKNILLVGLPFPCLKPNLVDMYDYKVLPPAAWKKLKDWYGCDFEIPRPVIKKGGTSQSLQVEVYTTVFQLHIWQENQENEVISSADGRESPIYLQFFSFQTLDDVYKDVITAVRESSVGYFKNIKDEDIRICLNVSDIWKQVQTTMEMQYVSDLNLERNDDGFEIMLVEQKTASGIFLSEESMNRWRYEIKIGDLIDALDSENKWYESRVIDTDETRIKVHYMGWTSKWDSWLDRNSSKISKLHTKVSNWRDLRIGDEVEAGKAQERVAHNKWYSAKVMRIDQENRKVLLKLETVPLEEEWYDIHGENICESGTHLKKHARSISPYTSSNGMSYGGGWGRSNTVGRPVTNGVVGLQNLGNTCFMNSMLQCLSNAQILTNYFLNGEYTEDINTDNPLGMGGKIAESYADLLKEIWSGKYTVVVPNKFKSIIGTFAPQFAGYQQQDSQELMSFLIDGLHEDLNRVKIKPYTESIESNGRADEVVAIESWKQYLRRNQSVIVDHCMAQLRSHLTCPDCGNESITFDPYMSLSVPLPVVDTRNIKVKLFWIDGRVPTRFSVEVNKDGCVLDVKKKLSSLCNIPVSQLLALEVFSHRVTRAFSDYAQIQQIRHAEIDVYELEKDRSSYAVCTSNLTSASGGYTNGNGFSSFNGLNESNDPMDVDSKKSMRLVSVLHRAPCQLNRTENSIDSNQKHRRVDLFGTPLVLAIPYEATNNDIHERMWNAVRRLLGYESPFSLSNLPYTIGLTNSAGTNTICDAIPQNDEPFELPRASIHSYFSIMLEWSSDGYDLGYSESEAERVEIHESMSRMQMTSTNDNGSIDLKQCFEKFTEREQLSEQDAWYCPKCKTHCRAYKKFDLWSVPEVLIIHLKRFRYAQSRYFMHRDKIDTLVTFPLEGLNMKDYIIGPQKNGKEENLIYDLFAVSEHSGGLGGGHYTAIGKNPLDCNWYQFNDSHTHETKGKRAISSQAYVLFFQRRVQPGISNSSMEN